MSEIDMLCKMYPISAFNLGTPIDQNNVYDMMICDNDLLVGGNIFLMLNSKTYVRISL